MGEVVQLRDFKRREENDADLVRLAKEVMGLLDTAPCEMPPVQPSYQAHNEAILERMRGIPANTEIPGSIVGGNPNVYAAPERDPA